MQGLEVLFCGAAVCTRYILAHCQPHSKIPQQQTCALRSVRTLTQNQQLADALVTATLFSGIVKPNKIALTDGNVCWHAVAECRSTGGVDITVESAGRQRFRHVMTWIIPPTLAGVLAWGFLQPDEQPLFSTGSSSHKGPVKGETLVNWSGTHTSKPK